MDVCPNRPPELEDHISWFGILPPSVMVKIDGQNYFFLFSDDQLWSDGAQPISNSLMSTNAAFLVALVVLIAAGEGALSSETRSGSLTGLFSCTETCKCFPRKFSSFVDHVPGQHGLDVDKGTECLGDSHFLYCNSCPPNRDANGKHMKTPESKGSWSAARGGGAGRGEGSAGWGDGWVVEVRDA